MGDRVSGWEEGDRYETREEKTAAIAKKLNMRVEDFDVFARNGYWDPERIPKHPQMRREMLKYLKKNEEPPATWMVISGLWPEVSYLMREEDRRKRVSQIYKSAVLLIRRALKRHEMDEMKSERGIFWEPVVEVCRALQIAPSKLSGFCKELTGNSLSQVIDNVRAEGLGKRLRAGVREFIRARGACLGTVSEPDGSRKDAKTQRRKEEKEMVWEELKESRKGDGFSRDTWAMGLGFGSYRKMYRACLCVFGKTVAQMEMECIKLVLDEKGELGEEKVEFKEWGLEEIQKALDAVRSVDQEETEAAMAWMGR